MAKKLIIANWKMNPSSIKEAGQIFSSISEVVKDSKNVFIVVCAPFIFLSDLKKKNIKKVSLGSQNISIDNEGAYTGEISAKMLKNFGIPYSIIGHSERRAMGENNEFVNKKIIMALKNKIISILCVGENERDHNGFYLSFVKKQLHEGLANVSKMQIKNIVIAYEPVWAIGKDAGRVATPEEFLEMSIYIRKIISDMYDFKTAHSVQIIYGGSVHPENTEAFLSRGKSDGFLIGRDSLNPKKFGKIISITNKIK